MYYLVVRDNMCERDTPHIIEKSDDREYLHNLAWEYEEQADNFERYSVMTEEVYVYYEGKDWPLKIEVKYD